MTRAWSQKFEDVTDWHDSFMCSAYMPIKTELLVTPAAKLKKKTVNILLPAEAELAFEVDQSAFIAEQQNDPTLATSGNGYFPQKLKLPACRVL